MSLHWLCTLTTSKQTSPSCRMTWSSKKAGKSCLFIPSEICDDRPTKSPWSLSVTWVVQWHVLASSFCCSWTLFYDCVEDLFWSPDAHKGGWLYVSNFGRAPVAKRSSGALRGSSAILQGWKWRQPGQIPGEDLSAVIQPRFLPDKSHRSLPSCPLCPFFLKTSS